MSYISQIRLKNNWYHQDSLEPLIFEKYFSSTIFFSGRNFSATKVLKVFGNLWTKIDKKRINMCRL